MNLSQSEKPRHRRKHRHRSGSATHSSRDRTSKHRGKKGKSRSRSGRREKSQHTVVSSPGQASSQQITSMLGHAPTHWGTATSAASYYPIVNLGFLWLLSGIVSQACPGLLETLFFTAHENFCSAQKKLEILFSPQRLFIDQNDIAYLRRAIRRYLLAFARVQRNELIAEILVGHVKVLYGDIADVANDFQVLIVALFMGRQNDIDMVEFRDTLSNDGVASKLDFDGNAMTDLFAKIQACDDYIKGIDKNIERFMQGSGGLPKGLQGIFTRDSALAQDIAARTTLNNTAKQYLRVFLNEIKKHYSTGTQLIESEANSLPKELLVLHARLDCVITEALLCLHDIDSSRSQSFLQILAFGADAKGKTITSVPSEFNLARNAYVNLLARAGSANVELRNALIELQEQISAKLTTSCAGASASAQSGSATPEAERWQVALANLRAVTNKLDSLTDQQRCLPCKRRAMREVKFIYTALSIYVRKKNADESAGKTAGSSSSASASEIQEQVTLYYRSQALKEAARIYQPKAASSSAMSATQPDYPAMIKSWYDQAAVGKFGPPVTRTIPKCIHILCGELELLMSGVTFASNVGAASSAASSVTPSMPVGTLRRSSSCRLFPAATQEQPQKTPSAQSSDKAITQHTEGLQPGFD